MDEIIQMRLKLKLYEDELESFAEVSEEFRLLYEKERKKVKFYEGLIEKLGCKDKEKP